MFLNIYSVLTGELTDVLTYKLLITNILYRQMLTVNLVVLELTLALTLSQGLSIHSQNAARWDRLSSWLNVPFESAQVIVRVSSIHLLSKPFLLHEAALIRRGVGLRL